MPYADPEKAREAQRRWREVNREKVLERNREKSRRYREANLEKVRESDRENHRRYRAADPEKFRQQQREYRERLTPEQLQRRTEYDRAYQPQWRQRRTPEQVARARERQRQYNRTKRDNGANRANLLWRIHGLRPEQVALLWEAQDRRCYLCGRMLELSQVVIDHAHTHCGDRQSCPTCRRGIACSQCNVAIGMAKDDPSRLRMIADNLEAANAAFARRLSDSPVQESLFAASDEGVA